MHRSARGAARLGSLGAAVLLAGVLISSSLIGSTASVEVRAISDASRDQPIDILLTAAAAETPRAAPSTSPETRLGGGTYLAPDAWMASGLISDEQIDAVAAIDGVEVVAPITVLPITDSRFGEYLSAWVPLSAGATAAWTATVDASVTDGTGTRRAPTSQLGALLTMGEDALVSSGVIAVAGVEAGAPSRLLHDGTYSDGAADADGVELASRLSSSRSFAVAIDPEAEAAIAAAAGDEELADQLAELAAASRAPDPGSQDAAIARDSPPLTPGIPIPALVSGEPRPTVSVTATVSSRDPSGLGVLPAQARSSCAVFGSLDGCAKMTSAGADALWGAPVLSKQTTTVTSPSSSPWGAFGHGYGGTGTLPVLVRGVFWAQQAEASGAVPVSLNRVDASEADTPTVRVEPVGSARVVGPDWADEVYRPLGARVGQVPALSYLAGARQTYTPASTNFLPGTTPMAASTLRTPSGPVLQTFDGTGAATSAAPALVSRHVVAREMSPVELGATAIRLRLARWADGGPPSQAEIERVSVLAARLGLHVTVLSGASPVDVDVLLGGSTPGAWHGRATETWTELGAVLRLETATAPALVLLPALAVLSVSTLAVLTGVSARDSRRRQAAVLLHAGWTAADVRARLVRGEIPGVVVIIVAGVALSLLPGAVGVVSTDVSRMALLSLAALYCSAVLLVTVVDAGSAVRRGRSGAEAVRFVRARTRRGRAALRRPGWLPSCGASTGIGWATAMEGRLPLMIAAILGGAVTAAGALVTTSAASRAGSSQLAAAGTGVVAGAARSLLILSGCAIIAVLALGMSAVRRSVSRRQRLLAHCGWGAAHRVLVELVAWVRGVAVPVLIALGLGAWALGALLPGSGRSGRVAAMLTGGGVMVGITIVVLVVCVVIALGAGRRSSALDPGRRAA